VSFCALHGSGWRAGLAHWTRARGAFRGRASSRPGRRGLRYPYLRVYGRRTLIGTASPVARAPFTAVSPRSTPHSSCSAPRFGGDAAAGVATRRQESAAGMGGAAAGGREEPARRAARTPGLFWVGPAPPLRPLIRARPPCPSAAKCGARSAAATPPRTRGRRRRGTPSRGLAPQSAPVRRALRRAGSAGGCGRALAGAGGPAAEPGSAQEHWTAPPPPPPPAGTPPRWRRAGGAWRHVGGRRACLAPRRTGPPVIPAPPRAPEPHREPATPHTRPCTTPLLAGGPLARPRAAVPRRPIRTARPRRRSRRASAGRGARGAAWQACRSSRGASRRRT
jgi:hypothetical protein